MKLYLLQVTPGEADIEVVEIAGVREHPTRGPSFRIAAFKESRMGRGGTTVHCENGQVIGQLDIDPNPAMRCWCTAKTRKVATKNLLNSSLDFAKECVDGWNSKALALRLKLGKL